MAKRWGKKSVKALFEGIGSYGLAWFQQRTDAAHSYPNAPQKRSRQAVENKALREWGPGGLTRGAYSLRELIERTGYSRTQLLRGRDALRQKWKRFGPRGNFLVSEEQIEEILEWLKHDYWTVEHRLYCCRLCTSEKKPHYGLGLCRKCYWRYRRNLKKRGLPTTVEGLAAKVSGLGNSRECGNFLDRINECIRRGISLEDELLDWLEAML